MHFLLVLFMSITCAVLFRDPGGFFLLSLLTLGATAYLHVHIGQRLEVLAGED